MNRGHLVGLMDSGTAPAVPDPEHWWQFNGDATDTGIAGTLYDGSATNVTYTTGKGGNQCAVFDGTAYVDVDNFTSIITLDEGTIAFWIYVTNNAANFYFAHFEGNYRFYDAGTPSASDFDNNLGFGQGFTVTETGLLTGQWYHFATTWNGTKAISYVDGVDVNQYFYTYTTAATDTFFLAAISAADSRKLIGNMQDVRVYDTLKTPAEIVAIKDVLA